MSFWYCRAGTRFCWSGPVLRHDSYWHVSVGRQAECRGWEHGETVHTGQMSLCDRECPVKHCYIWPEMGYQLFIEQWKTSHPEFLLRWSNYSRYTCCDPSLDDISGESGRVCRAGEWSTLGDGRAASVRLAHERLHHLRQSQLLLQLQRASGPEEPECCLQTQRKGSCLYSHLCVPSWWAQSMT